MMIAKCRGRRMSKSKKNSDAIRLAASIMGRIGGSRNTEAQKAARQRGIDAIRALGNTQTAEERRAAQMQLPEEVRIDRAKKAVTARWERQREAMSTDEFRELTSGMTAAAIAEALGMSASKVSSWRRKINPVRIMEQDADLIRKTFSQEN